MKYIPAVIMIFTLTGILLAREIVNRKTIHAAQFENAAKDSRLPVPWKLQEYKGSPSFNIEKSGSSSFLHVVSSGITAFGFKRDISIDLQVYPLMVWNWKAAFLPDGGDIRKREGDDQVMQIYLVFNKPADGLLSKPRTLAYVWDSESPKDGIFPSPQPMLGNVKYIIVRNKTDQRGKMFSEKRNVLKDYERAFGESGKDNSLMINGIMLFTNTHHTGTRAEGFFGNIFFACEQI